MRDKPMKTVELGYMSSGGTHFLFTPNIFGLPTQNPEIGQNGKEVSFLAFSKDWDICVAQVKDQAELKLGGQWNFSNGYLHGEDGDGGDIADLKKSTPKMTLASVTA